MTFLVVILGLAVMATTNAPALTVAEQVERAAARAAILQVAAPDRLELLSTRFGGADPVSGEKIDLELLEATGPNASGRIQLRFRMLEDGRPRGEARASVRGSVRGPALAARRTLPFGQPIPADAVELIDADLTRASGPPVRSVDALTGQVPVRSLGPGRAITADLLRPEPLVRRGETVNLTVQRGELTVVTKGTVKRDGAAGETVPAENIRTGARVLGRVQRDGSLLVVRGAIQGRQR